jgi:hypothetical protein
VRGGKRGHWQPSVLLRSLAPPQLHLQDRDCRQSPQGATSADDHSRCVPAIAIVFASWAASTWPEENAGANASGRTHRRLTRKPVVDARRAGESYSISAAGRDRREGGSLINK